MMEIRIVRKLNFMKPVDENHSLQSEEEKVDSVFQILMLILGVSYSHIIGRKSERAYHVCSI